jgi:mannosyltransferase OCH1-like enzyme
LQLPKIIHFIAPKDKNKWHPYWSLCQESWQTNFTNFKFIIWTDKQLAYFIKKKFFNYYNHYSNFAYDIYKYDFARLCVLYEYGGIYTDMDVFCYKNFYTLLQKECCIVGDVKDRSLSNFLICSTPKHKFLDACIKTILLNSNTRKKNNKIAFKDDKNNKSDFVLNTINLTGPGLITNVYRSNFYSEYINTIEILNNSLYDGDILNVCDDQITLHLYTSTWGKETRNYIELKYQHLNKQDKFLAYYNFLHFNQSNNISSIFKIYK